MSNDIFAATGEPEIDRVYLAQGGDQEQIAAEQTGRGNETIVVNVGPQHPPTHGVLRLILGVDDETVTHIRPAIGFLHAGTGKDMEFKTWIQGIAFYTHVGYVAPLFSETVYCLAIEKLLGITGDVPERAFVLQVLVMELSRIASRLVVTGMGGMEISALTVMTITFHEREMILDFLEGLTGLRMSHAYIRPGRMVNDLQDGGLEHLCTVIVWLRKHLPEYVTFCNGNPIFKLRVQNLAKMDLAACMMMGVTGPILRSTGYEQDLRQVQPYCSYETYDFDVVTWDTQDAYRWFRIRLEETWQSLRTVEQCLEYLERTQGQPVMVDDAKIAWPALLTIGPDGQSNSHEYVKHIMGESVEALIHHFRVVTEGFKVPVGQVYQAIEPPKGELGCTLVSDGGTHPYHAHFRDPEFSHLQSVPLVCEDGMISDVVVAMASIDPVPGNVDR